MREKRLQEEREKAAKTEELMRVYQERESQMVERLKVTVSTEAQAKQML